MKRDERKYYFFFEKCLRTPKSARCISSKCFETKSRSDDVFPNFSFEGSESYRVFDYLHDSNTIFLAARINTEWFSVEWYTAQTHHTSITTVVVSLMIHDNMYIGTWVCL